VQDITKSEAESAPADAATGDVAAAVVLAKAAEFFGSPEVREVTGAGRWRQVRTEIERSGTYRHSAAELLLGAKLAWRNHARCSGRYSWRGLVLNDARDARTAAEVAERCWQHLRISTNGGRLRPVITVFRQRMPGQPDIRIGNPQLIRYAGYDLGSYIVGDRLHVKLTRHAEAAGWTGAGGAFDILPVLISVDGRAPIASGVPADAVLEVPIRHPRHEWFAELGLRWHANPAISDLGLEIGGVEYTCAPFSGWYVSSEIGARNLSDTDRYNQLPVIASRLGLDTSRNGTLWKDRALLELNEAVIHSYAAAGVYIVDHHTASEQFVTHVDREHRSGRKVPADWSWVNPPMSASTTPTFHRSYDPPKLEIRPNFVKQGDLWDELELAGLRARGSAAGPLRDPL
jgi:nitric-oxide synthase, bacterial